MRSDTSATPAQILLHELMSPSVRRAVWLLGACQCALWGVLYYSFSVLLVPMERSLGLSRATVAGAFSVGLLAMALLAPTVGRWLDQGHATQLTRTGLALAAAGVILVAFAQGPAQLYLAWLLIGAAMAMLLYEPAFALVIRSVLDEQHRLRALAAVTVMGGLASTLFLPLVSLVIERWGWRAAALSCLGAIGLAAWLMERWVIPSLPSAVTKTPHPTGRGLPWPRQMPALATIYASGTLAAMALTTLVIPLLIERGVTPSVAALVLAALGIAQLPGRVWLLRGRGPLPGNLLKVWPIALQAAGLGVITAAYDPWLMAFGVVVFGVGAGLQTLSKPWLVQRLYGAAAAGRWNGEVARVQGFARAAGPLAVVAAAMALGTPIVLLGMVGLLLATIPLALRLPDNT